MNPILISPKIESDQPVSEQLRQMKSYLFQFKEEVEFLLMNVDSDNISEAYKEEMSRRFADANSVSEILQTAGMIKLQVEGLDTSVSSLLVDVNGIKGEVYDSQGHSVISQMAGEIALKVDTSNYTASVIVSKINNGSVKINANKIDLSALTEIYLSAGESDLHLTGTGMALSSHGAPVFSVNLTGMYVGAGSHEIAGSLDVDSLSIAGTSFPDELIEGKEGGTPEWIKFDELYPSDWVWAVDIPE